MDLFNRDMCSDLLPYDGTVIYYGRVFSAGEADNYLELLLKSIQWKRDEAVIYGKHYVTDREVAWYGEREFSYTYSGVTKTALPWTEELLKLKGRSEEISGATYNSCLLNLYHHGGETMAWHSDGEKMLLKNGAIASLSLGAERKFAFKHKRTKETVSIILEHGSLLVMKDATQQNWLHRLPPAAKIRSPRVNLTFRTISDPSAH